MTRRVRPRSPILWLQLLLVGGLASVVLILSQTFRASSSSRTVAERALRDYAGFAAWSYREHLIVRFREAIDEMLGAVNHGDGTHTSRDIPNARELGHYLHWDSSCNCHRARYGPLPLHYLGFTLGSDTLEVGANFAPTQMPGWLVDAPGAGEMAHEVKAISYPREESHWIVGFLSQLARRTPRSSWGYDIVVERGDSLPRMFASRSMPTQWGDTIVYAVEYSSASLDSLLRSVLYSSDLLPPSLVAGKDNNELLDLEVADMAGEPLFRTKETIPWALDAESALPASFGGLHIRAMVRPQIAEVLLIGGVPRSRVPVLLVLLFLAVALTAVAAVQLRREVRFATERADFVANVSHELRTPLTQVRLVLDTLRLGRAGDAKSRDSALGVADREVLRLQHLVEGVLRFTRGSRGDDSARIMTDVAREAQAVVEEFAPLAAPRGVKVEVRNGDEVPSLSLQHGALRQVLLNLLDNAVKYGRDDTTVVVEVRARPEGGACIAVSDSGPGVPLRDRERIWRSFERGSESKTRAVGGSGIGLTIVRQIAVEHGGRAWVEDAPGGGARFIVEIPAVTKGA